MDYERILNPIVDRLGEEAEIEFDDGRWEATSTVYVNDILFYAKWDDRGRAELLDCLHDTPHDRKDLSNLFDWINDHLWTADEIAEYHEEELQPYDEWDEHGFSGADDYYRYRFGCSGNVFIR